MIAIIGNHWVDVCDESGARRLDNPEDFVRIEIEAALKQDKRVIPVLVGLTQMPRSEQLPDTLKTLTRRHAVRLTHERFRTDAQGLIAGLQRALKSAESARGAQAQEEERKRQEAAAVRQQAEAEHLRREAETKRRAEEEERERKAEEQERQKEAAAVLSRQRADEERRARDAEVEQRAAEQRAFTAAKRADTVGAIDEFLRVYPTSQFAAEANALRATLLAREKAYEAVMRSNNPVELRAFLKRFTSGTVVEEVRGRLSRIEPELPQQTSRRAVVVGGVAAIGAAGIASAMVMIRRAPVPEETKPAPEETKPAPLPKPSVPASRLLHVLSGSTQPVEIVVFNRDGSRICTENSGGKEDTRLWDVSSGSLVASIPPKAGPLAGFSPVGNRMLVWSFYSSAGPPQLWDAQSGSLVAMLSGHTESLNGARFSPDGSLIVTASNDQTAPIWDGRTGGFMIDLRHSAAVWSATFDTEGKVILTTSTDGQARDGVARVWTKAGMLLTTISVPAAEPYGRIGAIFNPGGDLVLTTFDKFAQLWKASTDGSVQSSGKPIATIGLSRRAPVPLFNSDGSRIVTVVEDTARLWEGRTGAPVATMSGHTGDVRVKFNRDSTRIVTNGDDFSPRLWDGKTGTAVATLSGHTDAVFTTFSPDGSTVLTNSWDKTVRLWDAESGVAIATVTDANLPSIYAFSPDGGRIATIVLPADPKLQRSDANTSTAQLVDTKTGAVFATLSGHTDSLTSAAFSPDGKLVVTGSKDKTARIWDATTSAKK